MGIFSLDPNTEVSSVAIKVRDFERMVGFYRYIIGLDVLSEENDMAIMGIGQQKRKIIGLIATPEGEEDSNTQTGLYHMALVFPEQEQLAAFVKHLMSKNYPIEGQSDHGYCKSIYINDPEGNRLEFSWDRPKETWPMREGKIDGVTKELDLPRILNKISGTFEKLPVETKIGHVHLNVLDLEKSYDFYVDSLGFCIKDDHFKNKHFLTVDDYHHQVALEESMPTMDMTVRDDDLGVDHITFKVQSIENLLELRDNLNENKQTFYFNKGKKIIGISDPSGIQLWFRVFK